YAEVGKAWFWPRMAQSIRKYVKSCSSCQRNKVNTRPMHAGMQPIEIPKAPWQDISMDFMDLPMTLRGHDSLMVVTDLFGGHLRLIPTTRTVDAPGVADVFL